MTLVDSIIQYAASDKLDGDAWNTLVTSSVAFTRDDLPNVLRNAEDEFKERTGLTAMPSRWRSAKSVLLKARNNLVPMMDDNGQVIGKSAIERLCKGTKEVEEIDPVAEVNKHMVALSRLLLMFPDRRIDLHSYITIGVKSLSC
jgi:hypothetical protein